MSEKDDLKQPLYIDLDKQKSVDGRKVTYGTILGLYNNAHTGERVEMWWVDPGTALPESAESKAKGEELFVMEGSLLLGSDEFAKWGWLRFPIGPDNTRSELKAGSAGAQVYRKTGHLTEEAMGKEKIQISEAYEGKS
jgi:hypothetical protein